MRVCDWIAEYLYNYGVRNVYGIMGGGASGLNDGFIKNGKINYRCFHHEQGAGHAAIGESKFTGKLAVVNPTTGCGGMNCATSVLNAWQDSVPVLFLSGNVNAGTCSSVINREKRINLRKYGVQEHNVVDTFRSTTKFSSFVQDPKCIEYYLKLAISIATSGRPGPVWLDIPGNVQTAQMPDDQVEFPRLQEPVQEIGYLPHVQTLLNDAERPIILAGYGISQSKTQDEFRKFIDKYQVPFVATYGARDLVEDDHPLNVGTIGIKGSRAGNFAIQNADVLLILGASLGASQVGYDPTQFSPESHKIYVDCDINELEKGIVYIDDRINCDLQTFFKEML